MTERVSPELQKAFAPTGKLRASINLGNPVLAGTDKVTGHATGVSVDLARALGERLGVSVELVLFDTAIKSVTAVTEERADIGFLDDILGFAVVAQDSAGEPVKPAIVGLHDDANGRLVARAGALHQFGVGGPDGSYLRYIGVAHHDFALSYNMLLLMGWMRQRQIGSRHPLAD